jgi:hypothetical protein
LQVDLYNLKKPENVYDYNKGLITLTVIALSGFDCIIIPKINMTLQCRVSIVDSISNCKAPSGYPNNGFKCRVIWKKNLDHLVLM